MADFEERNSRPLVLIYGSLQTKDSQAFLRHFLGLAAQVLTVPIESEQIGRSPQDVAQAARELGLQAEIADSVEGALRELALVEWPQAPRILIAGSLYLVGATLVADKAELD